MKKIIFLFLILLIVFNADAQAHELTFDIVKQYPAITVQASYFKAEPLVNAAVLIFAPDENKTEYQKGNTDQSGYFAFVPTFAGNWKMVVDDKMGHRSEISITVSDDFFNGNDTGSSATEVSHHSHFGNLPVIYKIMFGLALVFGGTGILYWFKAKKTLTTGKS